MRAMPNTVIGLIEQLEADNPPKCKSPDESLDEHMHYSGKVALIEYLRARYEAEIKREQKGLPNVLS